MFRGNHPTRVDEKGRLKVPAEFKRLFDENYSAQFYITSWDGKSAKVYPLQEWEEIERKLSSVSNFNKSKQRLLKRTSYYGQSVEMDGQGRLLLPSILREEADLKGEVAVSGRVKFLEVQNAEELRKEVQEPLTPEDEQELDRMGI